MTLSLNECPVHYTQRVAWGDMDAFGHVNNVQYYRYLESARIDYFNQISLLGDGYIAVVASNSCRYLQPIRYPDTLTIGVRIEEVRRSGFRMSYVMYSDTTDQLVATAESVMVLLDQNHQKAALPDDLRDRIHALESSSGHDLGREEPLDQLTNLGRSLRDNLATLPSTLSNTLQNPSSAPASVSQIASAIGQQLSKQLVNISQLSPSYWQDKLSDEKSSVKDEPDISPASLAQLSTQLAGQVASSVATQLVQQVSNQVMNQLTPQVTRQLSQQLASQVAQTVSATLSGRLAPKRRRTDKDDETP